MNHQKNAETKNNKKSDSVSFNTAPRINKSRFEKLNKVKTIETKLNIKDLPASLKDKKSSEFGKFNDVMDFIQEATISKKLPNSNESESLDLKIDCLSENAKNIIEKCKLVNDLIKISNLKKDKSKSEDMPCIHRKTKNSENENENINNDSENENINNDLSIPVTLLLNKIDISHPNDDSSEESSEDSEISEDYENLIKKKDLPYIYGGLVGNIYKQSFNRKNKNNLIDDIEKTKLLIEELNKKLEPKKESKKPFIYRCISYLIRLGSKNKENEISKSKTENNDSTESTSETIDSVDLSEESSESASESTSETTESSEDSSENTSEDTSEDTESSEDSSETTSETSENQEVEDEYGESSVINKTIDWKSKFDKSINAIKLINSKLPNKYKGFIVGMLTTLIISKIYKN